MRFAVALALLGCDHPTPTPASATPVVDDFAATAAAMYDSKGHNYVAPSVLAYGRKAHVVIYPACRGGEGPGENCDLAGLDDAGKGVELGAEIHWSTSAGRTEDREPATKAIETLLRTGDAVRLSKQEWRGEAIELAGFGTIRWVPDQKSIVATRGGATTSARIEWGDKGGPVAVYWSPSAPVAAALLRVNPASGGREGYVVSVLYAVIPKP